VGGIKASRLAGLAALLAASVAVAAAPAFSQSFGTPPCARSTQSTITAAYQATTLDIYEAELASREVSQDLAHITSAPDLATAVADGDAAATLAATTRIVFTPFWHIVRLRVLSSSGQVLADVGGPYVLAPVTGHITYHGKVVGSFVMSVQDDLGYEKLVTRFTKLPIELYRNGRPLMGRDFPAADAPAHAPASGSPLTVGGVRSVADTYTVRAFPSGTTRVVLAIPRASAALKADSCAVVNAITYGEISTDVAKLFALPGDASSYVALDHEFDSQKLMFVRDGATQIASSSAQAGPVTIPRGGIITYAGQSWFVYSFVPIATLRVYILFPVAAPSSTTGASGAT
jgi:hypothetical protein